MRNCSTIMCRGLLRISATVVGLILVAGLAVACGNAAPSASPIPTMKGNAPWMTTPSTTSGSGHIQAVKLAIEDVATPEGSEPAFVGPNGKGAVDLFSVKSGQEVRVTIKNKDSMPHTFTVAQLSLNIAVGPNSTKDFSFLVGKAGTYSWRCAVPCGSWVMSHSGYMMGDFKVL